MAVRLRMGFIVMYLDFEKDIAVVEGANETIRMVPFDVTTLDAKA
jgi:hypothetical protein